MAIYWFIFCLFLIFVEITTVNLVSIWFAIGALLAMITALFTDSLLIQVVVFAVISMVALLATKPIVKKMKKSDVIPTNYDRVLGQKAEVVKQITESNYGEVKVLGSIWTAVADCTLEVGEKAIVERVDGVKLVVKKEEEK